MTLKGILTGFGGALLSLYIVENIEAPWNGFACFLIGAITFALISLYKIKASETDLDTSPSE